MLDPKLDGNLDPKLRRCARLSLLALLSTASWLAGSAAWAQAPLLQYSVIERSLEITVVYDDVNELLDDTFTQRGPLDETRRRDGAGSLGSVAIAQAAQQTDVSLFSARGRGQVQGDATLGGDMDAQVRARARSSVLLEFEVPVDAQYTLSGSFTATGATSSHANAAVSMVGSGPSFFFHSDGFFPGSEEEPGFLFSGSVLGGTTVNFLIEVQVDLLGSNLSEDPAILGDGTASFEFVLDFGDRDGDGLMNEWETNGIDFDGELPTDIDLPALGADPDHKDLFVEVDVMEGVPFDANVLKRVEEAFATAPAAAVDNPDGLPGINLHLEHDDGDHPPFTALSVEDWSVFAAIKDAYYGSPADRASDNADLIRLTRGLIFRYCLWADTLTSAGGLMGGVGETPGDDFVVAAGYLADYDPDLADENRAGSLMHELGHNLGLQHGGKDQINDKPNYLSVMNYLYANALDKVTPQGTNAKVVFRLDYSRGALVTLDETALLETQPLLGPSNRKIIFNSAPEGIDPVPSITDANAAVDWNASAGEPETTPYALDINRLRDGAEVELQTELLSSSDWDRLWYSPTGAPSFSYLSTRGASQAPPPDLEKSFFDALLSFDWLDLSDRSRIFADDFESGTTGWSVTAPP